MKKTIKTILLFITIIALCIAAYIWLSLSYEENIRYPQTFPTVSSFSEISVNYKHIWDKNSKSHAFTGAAVIDINNDGKMEIFIAGGENQDDALLSYQDKELRNIIEKTGLSNKKNATYGATSFDMDNDGDVDLLIARNNGIWLCQNNNGFFTSNVLDISLPQKTIPVNIAVTDLNKDNFPDIYVSTFVSASAFVAATFNKPQHAKKNIMLLNNGDLTFTDVTKRTKTAGSQNTFHSSFIDLNSDGHQELIVANNTGQIEIFINNGNLNFKKLKYNSGLGFWMGLGCGDIDADGDQDLFFSNIGSSIPTNLVRGDLLPRQSVELEWTILRNEGDFKFSNATKDYKLDGYGFAWGGVFEDINLDGKLDLLVAQNYIKWPGHKVKKLPGKAFLQIEEKTAAFYHSNDLNLNNPFYGQSPVIVDLNNDGKMDIIWINMNGPVRAFINKSTDNFLKVIVPDNLKYLGATLYVEFENGKSYSKQVVVSTGLLTDQSPNIFFGLGNKKPKKLIVQMPNQQTVELTTSMNNTVKLP
ncbi:FG-GAP repeat domain-containing protein [Candidatus Uabimicrobium sp. HlEnr_7]|uniref:FG-GAP repeat domain-containing protein n=1 Tax=Candidatus Uabimicrobium helgolandensis TaxID=3095367 RepID=UPI003556FB7C